MPNDIEWLIESLLREMPAYREQAARVDASHRFALLRALMNLRPPLAASQAFLARQDAFLRKCIADKGITDAAHLPDIAEGIALWRGDITTLRCDAIVNAANSALLGCFCPNHGCIDNAVHTFAGVQLRLACAQIVNAQGRREPNGCAKLTPGFNLPCQFVLHTVGPRVPGTVTEQARQELSRCYNSCLDAADQAGLRSVAFCCISTGEFRFPNEEAARIAIATVRNHDAVRAKRIRVIFNVFKAYDEDIYRRYLAADGALEGGAGKG